MIPTRVLSRFRYRRRPRGFSVALLGPDGAGKSTLADGITASFPRRVRCIYMGLAQQSRPLGIRRFALPGLSLATGLVTLWRRTLVAQYHMARGRLVVFDRYTYDLLLVPRNDLHWRERTYWWLLARACPAPNLTLVLDAPGTMMYERKREHTPEYLELQRQRFLTLRGHVRALEIVDATRGEDDVRTDVTALIERRWRRSETVTGERR
jgi:thymidylate kinase